MLEQNKISEDSDSLEIEAIKKIGLSDKISSKRKFLELTQLEFAKEIGVSRGFVARIESIRTIVDTYMSNRVIENISDVLSIPKEELLEDLENIKKVKRLISIENKRIYIEKRKQEMIDALREGGILN